HGGEAAHIRVSCGSDGGAGWLRVEDSGPGIAPEARAAVFGRFRRGAAAQGDGAGLGLSIVAAIVDRLDAQIVLERSPELGGLSAEIRFAQQQ
ncbi:ATP-binding protein, partial [Roseovarius sp.]